MIKHVVTATSRLQLGWNAETTTMNEMPDTAPCRGGGNGALKDTVKIHPAAEKMLLSVGAVSDLPHPVNGEDCGGGKEAEATALNWRPIPTC